MNVLAIAADPRRAVAPLFAAALLAASVGAGVTLTTAVATGGSAAPEPGKAPEAAGYGRLPLYFVHNEGQASEEIDFTVSGGETTLGFSDSEVTYARGDTAMTQTFVGGSAKPAGAVEGATFSWFKGDRRDWVTAPSYEVVRYEDVWPGIDAVYSGSSSRLKYRFVVSPGADPTDIRIGYDAPLALDGNGDLRVGGERGFTELAPVAYQGRGDARTEVASAYRLTPNGYRFGLGGYDPTRPLVIDPAAVIYAGFIGGSADDRAQGIAVDPSGNAYVTGYTDSDQTTFPVTGGPDLSWNGDRDVFIAKVNAAGTGLAYAGYIGGSGGDYAEGIAVDTSGNAYVTGYTDSDQTTFPVTGGPDLFWNGGNDAFVAKVNAAGTGLAYAGYIGGSGGDYAGGITVDSSGNAYVTGYTSSDQATFPETGGPDLDYNTNTDAFVAKVNAAGTGLSYAGYIGGAAFDRGNGIAVDSSGNAYVTGQTSSDQTTFPVTGGPDLDHNTGQDAFVAKVNAAGTGLSYAGYIGGAATDRGEGIAVDPSGNAYVTGPTDSNQTTFPVTGGPDLFWNGGNDVFVAKVNPSGTGLTYAGYIGGSGGEGAYGVAVDSSGNAYVTGYTNSDQTTFPVTGGPDLGYNSTGDAFVAKVTASGTGLSYAGYVGGSSYDQGEAVAVGAGGAAYIAGYTNSDETTFPETTGPDLTYAAGEEGFVAKVATERPDEQVALGGGAFAGGNVYNTTAAGQTKTAKVKPGKTATFTLRTENEGPPDSFTVAGSAGNSKFKATYLDGATNVTAPMVAGTHSTGAMASGATDEITLKVKLSRKAKGLRSFLVTATSTGDPSVADTVKAVVKAKK